MTNSDPSASRDAVAKETASVEMEAIHAQLKIHTDAIEEIRATALKQVDDIAENTQLTKQVLSYLEKGKIASNVSKWLLSVGAAVATIATYVRGH